MWSTGQTLNPGHDQICGFHTSATVFHLLRKVISLILIQIAIYDQFAPNSSYGAWCNLWCH